MTNKITPYEYAKRCKVPIQTILYQIKTGQIITKFTSTVVEHELIDTLEYPIEQFERRKYVKKIK